MHGSGLKQFIVILEETQMKAIVYTKYGPPDVLQLKEVAKPVPKDNQVLVKVHAASANALDYRRFETTSILGRFMDVVLLKAINTVLGADIAGRVEAVGAAVKQFQPGDEVFGQSKGARGAFAGYACADENEVALKPANLSFEAAAAVPVAALTALQGLRDKGQIQPGQKVLIHGASGGVGTFAVQIARSFGAEVTALCSSRNVDMARQIGADHVIDYTQEDFSRSGQRYDLIVAVNGNHPIRDYRRALNPGGIYVALGGSLAQVLQGVLLGPVISRFGSKKVRSFIAKMNQKDLVFIKELLEAGKVVPVIDRCYPLSETAEAIRYLVEGHARGKVVITVEQSNKTEQSPDHSQPGENS
jgi:NADPH:quinone reductase-like Zn-dependent oxidoreductase